MCDIWSTSSDARPRNRWLKRDSSASRQSGRSHFPPMRHRHNLPIVVDLTRREHQPPIASARRACVRSPEIQFDGRILSLTSLTDLERSDGLWRDPHKRSGRAIACPCKFPCKFGLSLQVWGSNEPDRGFGCACWGGPVLLPHFSDLCASAFHLWLLAFWFLPPMSLRRLS